MILYPPHIEPIVPAFSGDTTIKITIKCTHNGAVDTFKSLSLYVKDIANPKNFIVKTTENFHFLKNNIIEAYFYFRKGIDENFDIFVQGNYYKFQTIWRKKQWQ